MATTTSFLIVAGIPKAMARLFGERLAQKFDVDKWQIVWTPLPSLRRTYAEDYVMSLYYMFAKQLRGSKTRGRAKRCILGYVSYGVSDRMVLSAFEREALVFPFTDTNGVVFEEKPPARVRDFVGNSIAELRKKVANAESALDAIEKEVQSGVNRTPLLLPVRAFGNDDVGNLLTLVRQETLNSEDPFGAVKNEIERFSTRFPRKAVAADRRKYFVNKRGIVFKPHAGALHGSVDPEHFRDHDVECFPRASLRLGAGYESAFHYDCIAFRGGEFPTQWTGCHGQLIEIRGDRRYANVYPNDYVRG